MSLVVFSNSAYSYLWPIVEESVGKLKLNKMSKIFVCDENDLEKPKGFDQYITYDINNCYPKRWINDILSNIESEYILLVHDIHVIVTMDEEFILNNILLMSEYSIDRCSLNVFDGNDTINKYGIHLCNVNSARGNTITPFDHSPSIWNKKSMKLLFERFPNETYRNYENNEIQTFCKNNFKCYGQNKLSNQIFYCLGRPYLNLFKICIVTTKGEITYPIEVYMDMKDDFMYYSNKYKLTIYVNINNNYDFILNGFNPL